MDSQNYSFVVRVWLESPHTEGKAAVWRGSIEQVGSDCRVYFSDFDGITRYIRAQIGLEEASSPTNWQLIREQIKNGTQKFWKRFLRRNSS